MTHIITELSSNVLKAVINIGEYFSILASERELKCFGKKEHKLEVDFCNANHLTSDMGETIGYLSKCS